MNMVMAVTALGGLLAILGGAIYILITVHSVFLGKKLAPDESGLGAVGKGLPLGIVKPPRALGPGDDDSALPHTRLGPVPGTMVLVGIFLVAFIVYYFVNWKLLSDVWQVG